MSDHAQECFDAVYRMTACIAKTEDLLDNLEIVFQFEEILFDADICAIVLAGVKTPASTITDAQKRGLFDAGFRVCKLIFAETTVRIWLGPDT